MSTPSRTFAVLTGLALALSGLTMTAAHADTYDRDTAPTRHATYAGAWMFDSAPQPSDVASDPNPSGTDDPSVFAIAAYNMKKVQIDKDNPNNATGYSLGDGSIGDTSASGLAGPEGLGYDSKGRLWVADSGSGAVAVFSKSTSDSVPYTTIAGGNTGLSSPYDVAVSKDDEVFVANINGSSDSIRIFGAGRGGNIRPIKTINVGVKNPNSIAIDSKGLIYVANNNTFGGTESIDVYPANAESSTAPIRSISGTKTRLHNVSGIALDSSDNLYVASPGDDSKGSIVVFPAGSTGNVDPSIRLLGAATYIDQPSGIAVLPDRRVVVSNRYVSASDQAIYTFAPLIPLTAPTQARSLKVSGTSKTTKRIVRWAAPASNGGAPITKYTFVIKKGSKVLYNKTTKNLYYKILRSKLLNGTNTVIITATNKVGTGPNVKLKFTVKK